MIRAVAGFASNLNTAHYTLPTLSTLVAVEPGAVACQFTPDKTLI
jgi:hypothetical protein